MYKKSWFIFIRNRIILCIKSLLINSVSLTPYIIICKHFLIPLDNSFFYCSSSLFRIIFLVLKLFSCNIFTIIFSIVWVNIMQNHPFPLLQTYSRFLFVESLVISEIQKKNSLIDCQKEQLSCSFWQSIKLGFFW